MQKDDKGLMQFSIATNWDPGLLDYLEGSPVTSQYGQIWNDPLGGGRMSVFLPKIDKSQATEFIALSKQRGIGFTYLANATCFDNAEFTRAGYRKILSHLEWIASTGADMITVSLPFMLALVKTHFPEMKVSISSFARIQTVSAARFWANAGADKLILPEPTARDFKLLRRIRESVSCELELIANHTCLFHCPLDLHHRNMVSHGSQAAHACGGFAPDYCRLSCQREKLKHPEEMIRSRWIRPEDVDYYAGIGIDCLKLIERFRETRSLAEILRAYEERHSPANFAELLSLPKAGVYRVPNIETMERPDLIATDKMKILLDVLREPFTDKLHIDSQKLDGFLAHYENVDCNRTDCRTCGYCHRMAEKAITVDEAWRTEMIRKFDRAIEILTTGEIAT
ncbi:MAG: U32 family peptidase [Desulfobacterales bacterium]|nr:U32 family peptidase [Desulfobacterales bacterium]